MNTTHVKKNTAEGGTFSLTCRKWVTRSVAGMVLLFAAGSARAATKTFDGGVLGTGADPATAANWVG